MLSAVGRLTRITKNTRRTSLLGLNHSWRYFSGPNVPFSDDLSEVDYEDFNLQDFQHFKGLPEETKFNTHDPLSSDIFKCNSSDTDIRLDDIADAEEPLIMISESNDPYLNLAIEDYIYNNMPLPETRAMNYNRLFMYTNSPCVVVGKNQNPWKEVNIPLLTSLGIPLVRRRSGGGTVVHDLGNVNFSFMTTKQNFDRFQFANVVKDAINHYPQSKYKLTVNERGDITTEIQPDGVHYKVSGSAYKLSKGRSYHHGTMLLDSKLDVLSRLLSRDESKVGKIDSTNSVDSVKAKVKNIDMSSDTFKDLVANAFKIRYGLEYNINRKAIRAEQSLTSSSPSPSDMKICTVVKVGQHDLPTKVLDIANELKEWSWRYGNTPKFTHEFENSKFGFRLKFHVDKGCIVTRYELTFQNPQSRTCQEIKDAFSFLDVAIEKGEMVYRGSDIAGYVLNDSISDWIGTSIDGTI